MKPKKNPKTDLNRDRGLYFVLGLVVVLSLTYVALEWKSYDNTYSDCDFVMTEPDDINEIIPITINTPPPPPPPIAPDVFEIVPDEKDILETPIATTEPIEEKPTLQIDSIPDVEEPLDILIPITIVEEKPIFPGCENEKDKLACFQSKMQKHIQKNFRYPELEKDLGIQGKVRIVFTIQKDGSIGNLRMRGPNKNLEKEAARIIGKLPVMEPGKQAGKPVRVPFSIPITFKLQ